MASRYTVCGIAARLFHVFVMTSPATALLKYVSHGVHAPLIIQLTFTPVLEADPAVDASPANDDVRETSLI
jgi:hypothetical protein